MDLQFTVLSDGCIEIDVFRKKTHTNKYLDFASYNPMQHKEAVVKTLLNRANLLPSHPQLKTNEKDRLMDDLRANGYPDHLFKKCVRDRAKERRTQERPLGFAVLPYVKGVFDRVGRILQKFRIRTAFKPVRTLGHVYRKPKGQASGEPNGGDRSQSEVPRLLLYLHRGKQASSRGAEHYPGRASNSESDI